MAMLFTPDSSYAVERRKWEAHHTEYGPPGRPYTFQDYPLMIYKATRPSSGGTPILDQHIVEDEQQERNMRSRGFVRGPDHAVEMLEQSERELATAAAERAYQEQRMSAQAKEEAATVDEHTISHLGEIPETPIRRGPGRPRKEVP